MTRSSDRAAPAVQIHGGATNQAERRRDEGMANALASAEARGSDWCDSFVAAVKSKALRFPSFLAEDVLEVCPAPHGVNPKATGGLMHRAAALGYVRADGYAPANSSNRSPKTLWKSLIYRGGGV